MSEIPASADVARHESAVILQEICAVYARTFDAERLPELAQVCRAISLTAGTAIRTRDQAWLPRLS